MEPVIQKYLTALETKDFEALAELFTKNGHYCDYCANGTSSTNFIYMEKKPFPCFSGINFSSASIPYYRPRS